MIPRSRGGKKKIRGVGDTMFTYILLKFQGITVSEIIVILVGVPSLPLPLNAPQSMVIKSESAESSETAIQLCTNEHIHY